MAVRPGCESTVSLCGKKTEINIYFMSSKNHFEISKTQQMVRSTITTEVKNKINAKKFLRRVGGCCNLSQLSS